MNQQAKLADKTLCLKRAWCVKILHVFREHFLK